MKEIVNPFKYADLGIEKLFFQMLSRGGNKCCITAKIAGGASMFNFTDKRIVSDIGQRNIIATKEAIKRLSIPIIAEDVGGNKGRTMIFDSENGSVIIRSVGNDLKKL